MGKNPRLKLCFKWHGCVHEPNIHSELFNDLGKFNFLLSPFSLGHLLGDYRMSLGHQGSVPVLTSIPLDKHLNMTVHST
jgi:hypothetical protein